MACSHARRIGGLLLLLFAGGQVVSQEAPVDYATSIEPIFERSCDGAFCHVGLLTSGVELTTYDALVTSFGERYQRPPVVPFRSADSPLWEKVALEEPSLGQQMPLGRDALSSDEIVLLERWVDEGARPSAASRPLLRGDLDNSRHRNIVDAVALLEVIWGTGEGVPCAAIADTNADGAVDLSDAIRLLEYLFSSGQPLAPLLAADFANCP